VNITLIATTGGEREIAATGQLVQPGETIEVDDDLGASLCEQVDVWADATPRSKPKATPAADKQEK
jgi:hypothetical protein